MSPSLIIAIVCMTSALAFYTIGVWGERIAGKLKGWHLLFFWGGLIFDATGTTLMGMMAGKMTLDVHGITGALAIVLMFGTALWASIVLHLKQEKVNAGFHKFGLVVWILWLIAFFTGAAGAMSK
jgi:uncharacterized repeat protein (TIGR03987 family)